MSSALLPIANKPAIIAPVDVPAIKSKYSPSDFFDSSLVFKIFSIFSNMQAVRKPLTPPPSNVNIFMVAFPNEQNLHQAYILQHLHRHLK